MSEKQTNQMPKTNRGNLYFTLATFCASPFLLLIGILIVKIIFHIPVLLGGFVFALFFIPFLLLVSVLGVLFSVLAWKKNRLYRKIFLVLYIFVFIIYWLMLLQTGPL